MKKVIRRILILTVALVLAGALCLTGREVYQYVSEDRANQSLAEKVRALREQGLRPGAQSEAQTPEGETILPWLEELYLANSDLAGWLSIEDTKIDYPVVYTPSEQDRYLHLGFDGSYAASGTLFLAVPWEAEANHAVIYGHHMNDGSMFGRLNRYADAAYGREHAVIRFDTLTEAGEYELVAAFYSQIYGEEAGGSVFRYYEYVDLSSQAVFESYVRQVKAAALYDTGVEPVWGDTLLTLSTCEYHTDDGRFVVVARKIR